LTISSRLVSLAILSVARSTKISVAIKGSQRWKISVTEILNERAIEASGYPRFKVQGSMVREDQIETSAAYPRLKVRWLEKTK